MNVPFLDLARHHEPIAEEAKAAIAEIIASGAFIMGGPVREFEEEFATFCGVPRAVGVSSGLDALRVMLRAWEIGPGDEVITAANTFIATTLAVDSIGAKPVLVDCDPRTYNLDASLLEAAITERTKAIIPVHLYGQPADMDAVQVVADKYGLKVLEDASQAQGSLHGARRAGSIGDGAAFSLYPGKNLGAFGDAGIITTNSEEMADRVAVLRNYGSEKKYHHSVLGENNRLDTIQAAVLRIKLRRLDDSNEKRRSRAARYKEHLDGVGDLVLPHVLAGVTPVYHLFVIQTGEREALQAHLADRGVTTLIHYPIPIHEQPAYADRGWTSGQFPVTEELAPRILSLPIFPELRDDEVDHICDAVREFFGASGGATVGRETAGATASS